MNKFIPNIITSLRIVGSIILLAQKPFSFVFMAIYFLCILSDIADGYLARRFFLEIETGEALDSVADFFFALVVFFLFFSFYQPSTLIRLWVVLIGFVKLFTLLLGFAKYKKFASIHTYLNKFTGLLLVLLPIVYLCFGKAEGILPVLCFLASISAVEELLIIVTSKNLDRNKKSILLQD